MAFQGQISIKQGKFSTSTCTTENDLIANQAIKPAIRKFLEYKNRRYMMTYITSGAVGPYGINFKAPTRKPEVDKGKFIGNNAYRFDIMGRIEKQAVILSQIGSSSSTGAFSLLMQDEYLYDGAVVMFNSRLQARVMGQPTGSSSTGFTYNFQTVDGSQFVYATDVAGQAGTKTCMMVHSSYGEGSLRGYSRDKHPDTFVQHMTIQRATAVITGSADSDVLWYEYTNDEGSMKGWMYQKVQQLQAQMAAQDERHKLFGVSSMKNSDGSLRTISTLGNDPETGMPIIQGDGWEQQVSASSILYGSGVDGNATSDDFESIMQTMQLGSNQVDGITWVCLTGTAGFANIQRVAPTIAGNQNTTIMLAKDQTTAAGGAEVEIGYNFQALNINGNKVIFVKHTMFDDDRMFTDLDLNGNPNMSSAYFFMGIGANGDAPTMEILAKGANGVNRSLVEAEFVGLTGKKGMVQSEQDANKYACLKEDLFVIYNTALCGIIYKS